MRIVRVWIILLCVGLGVVGCAGGPPLVPVTDPTQRLEFEGFSVLPPRGEHWFMAPPALRKQQGPDVIVSFLKLPPSKTPMSDAFWVGYRMGGGSLLTPPSKTHTVVATV